MAVGYSCQSPRCILFKLAIVIIVAVDFDVRILLNYQSVDFRVFLNESDLFG